MNTMKKLALLCPEFKVQGPAQQLLDRFLIGFPDDGVFRRFPDLKVSLYLAGAATPGGLEDRVRQFRLNLTNSVGDAVRGADAVVICGGDDALTVNGIEAAESCRAFVYGRLARGLNRAEALRARAAARSVDLLAGTALPVTWRLPEVQLRAEDDVDRALVLVQGSGIEAEEAGLELLLSFLEPIKAGNGGIRKMRFIEGDAFWKAGENGEWSWELLSAALSRSDTPQGDPVRDGRTQDLVRLGLVRELTESPRGWLLQHWDGMRSAILVMNGLVNDINVAFGRRAGGMVSCQVLRPVDPQASEFDRLVSRLWRFFETGQRPWKIERGVSIVAALERMEEPASRSGEWIRTPE